MRPFAYDRATSAESAVSILAESGTDTRILAGGTTMIDLMRLDVERPTRLVDINRIPGLDTVEVGEDEVVLGALAKMSDVSEHDALLAQYPMLCESLQLAASQQLRNMATLGGNLLQRTRCGYFRHRTTAPCNKRDPGTGCAALEAQGATRTHALLGGSSECIATYPGDFAVALRALDTQVDVIGPDGERSIALADLYRLPGDTPDRETTLASDELVLRVRIAATPAGRASTYLKVRDRESYAFALSSAAVALTFDAGKVQDAHISLGGVATIPWRASEAEQTLRGRALDRDLALEAGRVAFADAQTTEQNAFRLRLGVQVVADALISAKERAR